MFTDSPTKRQIDAQANKAPRYLHKPTRCRYRVIGDDGVFCWLESVGLKIISVSRDDLADHNVWERLP
ncbi:hypothetical protein [Metapseudomonas otitidis]|uniref:hypothetical protein n=1 Tax=Metapseudomonas otitidis TaxID=319939 RepID=UPI002447EA20|nr:hypothetical protein [Pseudomonas otitidis]MDH0335139.1 hypothetical protein [Pseudomonas otitidis]